MDNSSTAMLDSSPGMLLALINAMVVTPQELSQILQSEVEWPSQGCLLLQKPIFTREYDLSCTKASVKQRQENRATPL